MGNMSDSIDKTTTALSKLEETLSNDAKQSLIAFRIQLGEVTAKSKELTENYIKSQLEIGKFKEKISNATHGLSDLASASGSFKDKAKSMGQSAGYAATGSAMGSMIGGMAGSGLATLGMELAAPFKKVFEDGVNMIRESFANTVKESMLTEITGTQRLQKRMENTARDMAEEGGAGWAMMPDDTKRQMLQQRFAMDRMTESGKSSFLDVAFEANSEIGVKGAAKNLAQGVAANMGLSESPISLNNAIKNFQQVMQQDVKIQQKFY